MTMSLWLTSAILGIVEGLTEFIPVSSTGHLILTDHMLGFAELLGSADKAGVFEVVIQLGAILAVGFLYRKKLIDAAFAKESVSRSGKLRLHLIIAFLPAAVVGFLFHKYIKEYLFSPISVAISLIIGGFVIILIEKMMSSKENKTDLNTMRSRDALIIGLSQILSLIPGVSRSGSTIMGGYAGGMTREAATEFSFLLSFPIMVAASGYELIKYRDLLTVDMLSVLAIGFAFSFISALVVVKWLIGYVRKHSFIGFGIYRVLFGIAVLLLLAA